MQALRTPRGVHTGEGRHKTTRRHLIALENGGLLIDMPGMRELGMFGVSEGMDDSFADIKAYSKNCRFADCTQTREPGRAVLRAIAQDELNAAHFQNYLKLKMDRAFGQLIHSRKPSFQDGQVDDGVFNVFYKETFSQFQLKSPGTS